MITLVLRQERIKRGWTLEYAAEQIGITKSAFGNIETAKRKPSYDVLCKLEDIFQETHRRLFAVADGENT